MNAKTIQFSVFSIELPLLSEIKFNRKKRHFCRLHEQGERERQREKNQVTNFVGKKSMKLFETMNKKTMIFDPDIKMKSYFHFLSWLFEKSLNF